MFFITISVVDSTSSPPSGVDTVAILCQVDASKEESQDGWRRVSFLDSRVRLILHRAMTRFHDVLLGLEPIEQALPQETYSIDPYTSVLFRISFTKVVDTYLKADSHRSPPSGAILPYDRFLPESLRMLHLDKLQTEGSEGITRSY